MSGAEPVFALILAGGRGRRMGEGAPKPFRDLAGRPLVDHVLERLAGRVDRVLVSAPPGPEWRWTGCEQVPDEGAAFGGPAVGIASALRHLRRACGPRPFQLVTAPADAPFLPRELTDTLLGAAGSGSAVAAFGDACVPTCALWRSVDAPTPADASGRSIRALLAERSAVAVPFPPAEGAPDGNPFFNVNTPHDLERAERCLARA